MIVTSSIGDRPHWRRKTLEGGEVRCDGELHLGVHERRGVDRTAPSKRTGFADPGRPAEHMKYAFPLQEYPPTLQGSRDPV